MPKEQTTQLQQAAESFYLDCEIRHLTPVTLIWYRKYVGALVTWLQDRGTTTATGIILDLLRAYVAELQSCITNLHVLRSAGLMRVLPLRQARH